MAFQTTIYSLHTNTALAGCSAATLFDDYEKLIAVIKAQYSNHNDTWLEQVISSLSTKSKGTYQFYFPYEEEDDIENDTIYITIATLPI